MKKCLYLLLLICLAGGSAWAEPASQIALDPVAVTANTGEKPQSKVWQHAGAWWSVLPNSQGMWLRKLVGTTWTDVLNLSSATTAKADCEVAGNVVHVLLFTGTTSELVSVQYNGGTGLYELWTTRPTPSSVTLDSGVEIATIDIDSNGRMWLASDASTTINVRYSDSPYSSWSSPITLATGVSTDDISVVTALPNGTVAVLWSNQSTKRFGCRTHTDGADPNTWSADEVPASQSANDGVGAGMADDHLNVAVASDGTLYLAVKTSYDTSGYPLIALLVRRPGGTWDNLYEVSQTGTRGIVLLNEVTGTVSVVYTDGNIVFKESPTSSIAFGSPVTLMSGSLNDATSTKQNITNEVVVLASSASSASGVLRTFNASVPSCLVGWWPMEEGGGSILVDASGSGNNAALSGAPTWGAGVIGSALHLNGTTDQGLVPDAASLDITGAITLAAWIKPEKSGTQYVIKKAIGSSASNGYELSLSSTGKAFGRLNTNNLYRVDATTSYPINGTTWMHLAMTYDGAMIRLYVNGVQEASVAATIAIAANNLSLGIGAQSDGASRFQGSIDDARVYCRALGPSEIQGLLSPPNSAPIALCKNVTVALDSVVCWANVDPSQVDNGSFDPDGDAITLSLVPPGPYPSGVTLVDLIASDGLLVTTCAATITINCTTPDPECLAGQWSMEEGSGTTVVDSSSQGNNGVLSGSPTWATGVYGQSLHLNGTTDYALVPDAASLDITNAITLAAWVKPEKVATQYLVKKAVISATNGYELSLASSGKAFVRFNQFTSADGFRINSTTSYPTDGNTWMHLAATYDGVTMRLYVNGVQEASLAATFAIATNNLSLGIGAQSNGATLFQGGMDEARVYCRALSASEIQALAQPPVNNPPVAVCQNVTVPSGQTCPVVVDPSQVDNGSSDPDGDPISLALEPPGPYPNGLTLVNLIVSDGELADTCAATITVDCEAPPECLAGLWQMEEGSGPTVFDSSGNGNNGALFGSPTWATGVYGLSLDLNGTTDYALVPDAASLDITDEITLAAWVKPEKTATQYLIKKAVISVTNGYELSLATTGKAFVRFNQFTSANTYRIDSATSYPTDGNTWVHLAATYDGSTIRLYVNGVEEASLAATFAIATNNLSLGIGAQSNGATLFQGGMDEARVYCRALSAGEIQALAQPPATLYTIMTNTVGNGSVGLNPAQPTYVFGDTVFVTATADPGWSFSAWSGDLIGSENPDTLIVSGNASITATFTQDLYTITTNTVGSGTVGLNPAQPTYVFGDTVFVTATADPGWSFSAWSGDLIGSENPDTLIVSGNASITGTFTQDLYTIITNTVGSGTVGLNPSQPTYVFGDTVFVTATAGPGWSFSAWSGDLIGSENPDTLIVSGNASITGTFTQDLYTITTNTVGSGTVGLNPAQPTYVFGDTVFVTATADPGWSFGAWSGDLIGSENPDTLIVSGNASITATFTQDLYTITTNTVGSGTVGLNPAQPTYAFGDTVFVTATADPGWSFGSWSGDLIGSENPDTLIVGGNASITGTFTQDLYTITTNTVGSGSVGLNPSQPTYAFGDTVFVTATADPGWSFSAWSGDLTGSENPDTLIVSGNASITATFTQDLYTITTSTVGSGTVGLNPSQPTYVFGDTVFVTATAGPGWSFSAWSGDLIGSENPDTLIVSGNASITGTFTQDLYTITTNTVGSGTVGLNPAQPTYVFGDTVVATATAAPGWSFSAWSGDLIGSENPDTLIVSGNASITGTFTQDLYTIITNTVGSGTVGLNPAQPTYVFGDTVFVTATADPGWSFESWSGDLIGSENPDTLIVSGNASITATFTQDLYTITTNTVGSGTVGLNPAQPTYAFGDTVFVTATADPGWSFGSWSGDLIGSENPDTLIVGGNASITGTFTQDLYTITTNTVGSGSVGLNPSQPTYAFGDTVFVTATADPGWSFSAWSGDLTGSENPDTLIVSGNASITATFTQDLYTITTSTVGNGAVGLNPPSRPTSSGTRSLQRRRRLPGGTLFPGRGISRAVRTRTRSSWAATPRSRRHSRRISTRSPPARWVTAVWV